MGQDPKFICQKQQPKTEQAGTSPRSPQPVDAGSSDEDEEEEDIPSTSASQIPSSSAVTGPKGSTQDTMQWVDINIFWPWLQNVKGEIKDQEIIK